MIMIDADMARKLETAITIVLSVSKMKATEIARRKTPRYKLALLTRNCVNSVRISLLYLINKIVMEINAKKEITMVYVKSVQ